MPASATCPRYLPPDTRHPIPVTRYPYPAPAPNTPNPQAILLAWGFLCDLDNLTNQFFLK